MNVLNWIINVLKIFRKGYIQREISPCLNNCYIKEVVQTNASREQTNKQWLRIKIASNSGRREMNWSPICPGIAIDLNLGQVTITFIMMQTIVTLVSCILCLRTTQLVSGNVSIPAPISKPFTFKKNKVPPLA